MAEILVIVFLLLTILVPVVLCILEDTIHECALLKRKHKYRMAELKAEHRALTLKEAEQTWRQRN